MKNEKGHLSIFKAILLVLGTIVFQVISVIAIGAYYIFKYKDVNAMKNIDANTLVIVTMISVLAVVLIGVKISRTSISELFKSPKLELKTIICAIILAIGCWCLMCSLSTVLQNTLPIAKQSGDVLNKSVSKMTGTYLGIVYIVLIAPIIEETLFRGVILQGILKKYNTKVAVIVSAVLFGIFHFNFVQSIFVIVLALGLALIYFKTGSLLVCIIAHIVNNSCAMFVGRFLTNVPMIYLLVLGIILAGGSAYRLLKTPNKVNIFNGSTIEIDKTTTSI